MATFRNRDGKWQARVRRQGYAAITKSFTTLQDAEKWARSIEIQLDKNTYTNTSLAEKPPSRRLSNAICAKLPLPCAVQNLT